MWFIIISMHGVYAYRGFKLKKWLSLLKWTALRRSLQISPCLPHWTPVEVSPMLTADIWMSAGGMKNETMLNYAINFWGDLFWFLSCRVELEQRQLVHTIQLLKLELSQKQLLLDVARNEQASQLEELQEQLANAAHEKKLMSLRLQSLSHNYEHELRKAEEKLQEESARVGRERVIVSNTETIFCEIKKELEETLSITPSLSKDELYHLQSTDISLLTIRDYVQVGHLWRREG